MTLKKVALFVIPLAAIVAAAGWWYFKLKQPETVMPKRTTAVLSVYATGFVEPTYEADISAKLEGHVKDIYFDERDEVHEDEILAQLDDALEKSKVEEFQAVQDYLQSEVERLQPLYDKNFVSKRDFEKAAKDLLEVKARLKTQYELIEKKKIRSPLDGTVLKRDIEIGEYIPVGQIVFSVGKLKPLRVTAEVDEEEIPLVSLGQKALMKSDAFPEIVAGEVYEITPKGDPIQKNFRVRIRLPEDTQFLVGMTVDVNIIVKRRENALMIPKEALINGKVLVKEQYSINERKVEVGIVGDDMIEILDGLSEEDKVLLDPDSHLRK